MWLHLNRQTLAAYNIGAFEPLLSHRIAVECLSDPDTINREDVIDIKVRTPIDTALSNVQAALGIFNQWGTGILSSEYFSVTEPALVKCLFERWNLHVVQIILYVRRQDLYAAAGYSQDVAALGQRQPFICIENPSYGVELDWAHMYKNWSSSFPDASFAVRNYDKYRSSNLLLIDFCNLLGCPLEAGPNLPERANESLNSEMTELARMLNLHSRKFARHQLLLLQQMREGRPFGFSHRLTQTFEDKYRPSNIALASKFPDELTMLTATNWEPVGFDMTGMMLPVHFDELCREMAGF
jgi:hypothetical protein